jgi:hypothetical protein
MLQRPVLPNSIRFDSIEVAEGVPLEKGGTFAWKYADPCGLLMMVVSQAPLLSECFKHAAPRSPPTPDRPWSLVLAWDEFCPGNKLQIDPSRKAMVWSSTFLALGQDAISSGLAWTTPVLVRTAVLRKVASKWPNLLRLCQTGTAFGPASTGRGMQTSSHVFGITMSGSWTPPSEHHHSALAECKRSPARCTYGSNT